MFKVSWEYDFVVLAEDDALKLFLSSFPLNTHTVSRCVGQDIFFCCFVICMMVSPKKEICRGPRGSKRSLSFACVPPCNAIFRIQSAKCIFFLSHYFNKHSQGRAKTLLCVCACACTCVFFCLFFLHKWQQWEVR